MLYVTIFIIIVQFIITLLSMNYFHYIYNLLLI